MSSLAVMQDEQPEDAPEKSKRLFIGAAAVPEGVLGWTKPAERAVALQQWRTATGRAFPEAARVLRVAWALEWLFGRDGFAFPTDGYLEAELAIPMKKIQAALLDLERSGAIIRASVMIRGRAQRRIWPSTKIVECTLPTMGVSHPPHVGAKPPPTMGGEKAIEGKFSRSRRLSSTADAARRDAELRETRARERGELP